MQMSLISLDIKLQILLTAEDHSSDAAPHCHAGVEN